MKGPIPSMAPNKRGRTVVSNDAIIVRCGHCGTKNRIPTSRLQERPLCGKCGAPIDPVQTSGRPVDVTDRTFQSEVLSFPGPVLVDCWAPWCGPCRAVGPVLEQLASDYGHRLKVAKLNVDENPGTASQYAVQNIPTLLFFKNGQFVTRQVGAVPKHEIERHLETIL
jgi:thioredoxin 2